MRLRLSDRYSVHVQDATGPLEITVRLAPWSGPGQSVEIAQVLADPAGQPWRQAHDGFGNRVDGVAMRGTPMQLRLTCVSELTRTGDAVGAGPAPAAARAVEPGRLTAPSAAIAAYARAHARRAGDDPGAVLRALAEAVGRDLRDDPGATALTNTAAAAFAAGAGVCQDRAHVTLAAARSLGVPAYYIGGYVADPPAPGRTRPASPAVPHAWVGLCDDGGAQASAACVVDPSDPAMGRIYIPVACGRDFADVQPIRVAGPGARFRSWRSRAQVEWL
jgi:transglutaminase-like putative cysteine protease